MLGEDYVRKNQTSVFLETMLPSEIIGSHLLKNGNMAPVQWRNGLRNSSYDEKKSNLSTPPDEKISLSDLDAHYIL